MAFKNFIQELQKLGKKQVEDSRSALIGDVGDSALGSSIKYMVQGSFKKKPQIIFSMNDYGGFVDTGVKGVRNQTFQLNDSRANKMFSFTRQPAFTGTFKMINPSAIDKWVIKKGLKGTRDAKGRFVKRSAIKFAIATSIYKKGLDGTGFFSQTWYKNMELSRKNLETALAKDMEKQLNKTDQYFV
tara:strand:- start:13877 stop:14434 length:558 start_codon:yes stop_codon:yes gene_type:complete